MSSTCASRRASVWTMFCSCCHQTSSPVFPPINEPPGFLPNRSALTLALFGWQGLSNPRIGAVPNSASCHTCLRRLGLWMFKSKEVDADGNILVSAPMEHLDTVREHRSFCPWKNPQAQSREPSSSAPDVDKTGWGVALTDIAERSSFETALRGALPAVLWSSV